MICSPISTSIQRLLFLTVHVNNWLDICIRQLRLLVLIHHELMLLFFCCAADLQTMVWKGQLFEGLKRWMMDDREIRIIQTSSCDARSPNFKKQIIFEIFSNIHKVSIWVISVNIIVRFKCTEYIFYNISMNWLTFW